MMAQYRFIYLLGALTSMLLVSPFVQFFRTQAHPEIASIIILALFAAVLLAAVFAVSKRRQTVMLAGSLAVALIFLRGLNLWLHSEGIFIAQNVFSISFLAFTIILLLKLLFSADSVTFDTIAASLCVYLLLGVLWAIAYSLLSTFDPDAFSMPGSDNGKLAIRFGAEQSATALYFSYVTLTTLGYGDVTPATMPARMLTTLEAIMGQIYLAVLVARLVGLHISQAAHRKA